MKFAAISERMASISRLVKVDPKIGLPDWQDLMIRYNLTEKQAVRAEELLGKYIDNINKTCITRTISAMSYVDRPSAIKELHVTYFVAEKDVELTPIIKNELDGRGFTYSGVLKERNNGTQICITIPEIKL